MNQRPTVEPVVIDNVVIDDPIAVAYWKKAFAKLADMPSPRDTDPAEDHWLSKVEAAGLAPFDDIGAEQRARAARRVNERHMARRPQARSRGAHTRITPRVQPRRRGAGRPGARRAVSRSSGGGSSGDDPPGEPLHEQGHRDALVEPRRPARLTYACLSRAEREVAA